VELKPVASQDITALREERRRTSALPIMPGFHERLAGEAQAFLVLDRVGREEAAQQLGYVLLLERPHGGHSHVTLIELHLGPEHQDRYEDVLDLIRLQQKPTAYLARTDDCRLNATLLARGHQVEVTALVLLPAAAAASAVAAGVAEEAAAQEAGELVALTSAHLPALRELLGGEEAAGPEGVGDGHRHHGPRPADAFAELEALAGQGRNWALLRDGRPVAVLARTEGGDGEHDLLDFAVARGGEVELAQALRRATEVVRAEGRRPAAVIDAAEAARRRIFRAAGYYSAAAYMVFYDPDAGRPSIGTVGVDELRAMMAAKERFRLVDVLGEEHWHEGHLPGAEWIDFRGLAREARRRFEVDEPLVLYSSGFT